GLNERAVEREVDIGQLRRRRKAPLVGGIVAAERADVVQRADFAAHHPLSAEQIGARRVRSFRLATRLVEARRQQVDKVDVVREFAVLLSSDVSGNEDPQVTYALVESVDDRLSMRADVVDVVVTVENPSERLLRRGDVVT